MIKILHIELDSNLGGIESFILNISNKMNAKEYSMYAVTACKELAFKERLLTNHVNIFHVASHKHIFRYYLDLKRIIENGQFDIIHIHKNSLANVIPIIVAKKYKIPFILHSHNTAPSKGKVTAILHLINRKIFIKYPKVKLACGNKAARWMFKQAISDVKIINNGIEVEKYVPNIAIRTRLKNDLKITDCFVICHVGRFVKQKNHEFLLRVFNKVYQKHSEAVLLLVGVGEEKNKIQTLANKLGISNVVLFLGERNDVNDILRASDLFVFPSLYEGLSIATVEAQAAGLRVITSDTVSKECNITGNVSFLPINQGYNCWIDKIEESMVKKPVDIEKCEQKIRDAGYDIENTVRVLSNIYTILARDGKFNDKVF